METGRLERFDTIYVVAHLLVIQANHSFCLFLVPAATARSRSRLRSAHHGNQECRVSQQT